MTTGEILDLKNEVVDALIEEGYARADAAAAVNAEFSGDAETYSTLLRRALEHLRKNHMVKANGNGARSGFKPSAPPDLVIPQPVKVPPPAPVQKADYPPVRTPPPAPALREHPTRRSRRARAATTSHFPPSVEVAKPEAASAEAASAPPEEADAEGFRLVDLDEFQQTFTRSGVMFDPWARRMVGRIKAMPLGSRAQIALPKGKSAGGFRDTVGRHFKKASFVVRVFSLKGNDRLLGIAKEERVGE